MKGKMLIQGVTGSPGIAIGKVRIIKGDVEDGDRVEKGDILVCDTWAIENAYINCIQKAAALVQNTGGRTTYGAVRSHVENIPCLVGTVRISKKKATEVLKEGMMVVVEGESGEMQILQQDGKARKVKYGTVYQFLPDNG
jgi:pyruvate, water dikinase